MKRLSFLRTLVLVLVSACHSASTPSVKQPDGSWHVQCGNSLDLCVRRANELCDNRGYVVLGGVNKRQLLGAELGQSQVEVREAELSFACADRRGDLPKVLTTNTALALPPSGASAVASGPAPAAAPPKAPATACIPGTTQHCVGSAACSGGQACLPDGSGFSPCDCGTAAHGTPSAP